MRRARVAVTFMLATVMAASALNGSQLMPTAGAFRALTAARSLKCSFPWYASADWDSDEPVVKSARQDFGFQIDGIDHRQRAARIIGNAGADDIVAISGDDSVSFIEQVPAGTVNVTTVYAWRDKQDRFKAVHSRHVAIGGPAPSQNYGFCQVWQ